MKKGFTLLELLIVMIIVGILATLGFTQYTAVIERSRGAEARQILGQLRSMCAAKYMEMSNTSYCNDAYLSIGTTGGIPNNCTGMTSHYFNYSATTEAPGNITFNATRCSGTSGKPPAGTPGNYLSLKVDYAAGGSDKWNSTGGY